MARRYYSNFGRKKRLKALLYSPIQQQMFSLCFFFLPLSRTRDSRDQLAQMLQTVDAMLSYCQRIS